MGDTSSPAPAAVELSNIKYADKEPTNDGHAHAHDTLSSPSVVVAASPSTAAAAASPSTLDTATVPSNGHGANGANDGRHQVEFHFDPAISPEYFFEARPSANGNTNL